MQIASLEQGTPSWLAWRTKGLGSSDASVIWFGQHFDTDIYKLWCEKSGKGTQKKENSAMARGKKLEPAVREMYQNLTGFAPEALCASHDILTWLKASLDGWDALNGILVEIKCPKREHHQSALDDKVPETYVPQLYHQYLVCEEKVKEIHYVSYSNYFSKAEQLAVVDVPLSEEFKSRAHLLLQKEKEFWSFVERRLPPPKSWLPCCQEIEKAA